MRRRRFGRLDLFRWDLAERARRKGSWRSIFQSFARVVGVYFELERREVELGGRGGQGVM